MRVDLEQRLCDRADTAPANELLCCGSGQSAAVSHLSAGCSLGEILRNSGERWSGFLGIHLSASALQLCNLGGTAVCTSVSSSVDTMVLQYQDSAICIVIPNNNHLKTYGVLQWHMKCVLVYKALVCLTVLGLSLDG